MSKTCDHGNMIDPENGIGCIFCMAGVSAGQLPIPDGIREEYLEKASGSSCAKPCMTRTATKSLA